MAVLVVAADEPAVFDAVGAMTSPDHGVVTVTVPPIDVRPSGILRLAMLAIDARPLVRPASGEAQATENALARLRSHGLATLIVRHAAWLPERSSDGLMAALALAGIEVVLACDGETPVPKTLVPWIENRTDWDGLVATVRERVALAAGAAADPARHQHVPFPLARLVGLRLQPARPDGSSVAAASQRAVRRTLAPAPSTARANTALRRALRQAPQSQSTTLGGAICALGEVSDHVYLGDPAAGLTWRDLRRLDDVSMAAATTLVAVGFSPREIVRLRPEDVTTDGSSVRTRRGYRPVEPGARAYLVAARLLARPGGPLVAIGNDPQTVPGIATLVASGLQVLGIDLEARDVERAAGPSGYWLARRGILLRRTRHTATLAAAPPDGPSRRCRHGLTGWVPVAGAVVFHSQKLCRAIEPDEIRSPPYCVLRLDEADAAIGFAISCEGRDAGMAWRVETPLGAAWVQSLEADRPATAAVAAGVRAFQHISPSSQRHTPAVRDPRP